MFLSKRTAFLLIVVVSMLMTSAAMAVTVDIPPTGSGLSNSGDLDYNWTVGGNPSQLLTPSSANWGGGGWVPNGPDSSWIGKTANNPDNGPAPYTFRYQFDLSQFKLATVSLSGSWTIDDAGTLGVNGKVFALLNPGDWGSLHAFSLAPASGYLNQGLNILEITMTYTDNYLEGARLQGTITGDLAPLPGTMLLLGSGLLGLAGFGWRRV